MLVLSRRIGEKLVLGDDIEFQILEICGNRVRIGINAPKSINIVREEIVRDKIVREEIAGTPREETSSHEHSTPYRLPVRPKQKLIGLRRRQRRDNATI